MISYQDFEKEIHTVFTPTQ